MANSNKRTPITIKDIARMASVSQSTVSKALNNRPDVNEDTRNKILEIAKEHHFRPNIFGKSLKSQRTESIGVLICRENAPPSGNPFYSRVLEGIEAELALKNYSMTLDIVNGRKTADVPKVVREGRVDGLILIGVFDSKFIDMLTGYGLQPIFIDPKIPLENHDQVLIDNEHGAFLATQYLASLGHKKIGFISGSLNRLSFLQRYEGYKQAMDFYKLKLDESWIETGGVEEGYHQIRDIMSRENRPSAIFCANDINAIKGYRAIHELGLKIPDDVSLVGFDDIEFARHAHPALSSVRVYKEELGSLAVRSLFRRLNGELNGPVTTVVPVKLINRDSAAVCEGSGAEPALHDNR